MGSKTSFGSWIKQRRKVLDWTQDELARQSGCALSTIRKIEQDQRRPSKQIAEHLLMCLGVEPAEQEALIRLARAQPLPELPLPFNWSHATGHRPPAGPGPSNPAMQPAPVTGRARELSAGMGEAEPFDHRSIEKSKTTPIPGEHPSVRPTNLPVPPTSFIGWAAEVERLQRLFQNPNVRLVTIIGPGGAGKTRLSLQVASQLVDNFKHGVFFVALGTIREAHLVETTIAQALGVKESDDLSLTESLTAYLKNRHILLVLDNFEHVLRAAPLISDLLVAARHLKVLVTSRAVLRLYGEHEFEVPPLALPDLKRLPPPAELAQAPAVALFIERARAVQPDFNLNAHTAPAVAELCTHLDGLPLAIELAAARIKLLSPQAMATRLSNRLALLTDGAQNLPQRQQTMRDTLDWSYELLSPEEKGVFTRLGVFMGGCTLEAVESVAGVPLTCGSGKQVQINPLDQVASLLDKSMLVREVVGAEHRFKMLETIHEYASERLDDSEDAGLLRQRHTAYYLRLAETAQPELTGADSQIWLERLEREHDNLRAALRWALQRETQTETALRLATILARFWKKRGYLGEGRRWLEAALAHSKTQPAVARAWAFRESASLALGQGDFVQARAYLESGQALWGDLGDEPFVAWMMGLILDAQGKYDEAQVFLETNLAFHRKAGNRENVAHALHLLGQSAMKRGQYDQACVWLEESIAIRKRLHAHEDIGMSTLTLGHIMRLRGDYPKACQQYQESLALFQGLGEKWGVAHCLLNMGKIACVQGEYAQAHRSYLEALITFQELGDRHGLAYAFEAQGSLAGLQKQPERAARLWGAATALREALGTPLPPVEYFQLEAEMKNVEAYLAASGQSEMAFMAAWQAGRMMSPEEAFALAREFPG
jgi:predicted ATPase/transcriptional regulator with XRE-family HTH domain